MKNPEVKSIRQAFGDTLCELAGSDPNLFVVDIDLRSSLGLDKFANKFRSRFIECGIAENNAAGVAAGLAKAGKNVFLTSFACFSPGINWAVIKQSICYNSLNVKIVGSHAGLLTGDLGGTHQMLEDVALMRSLPNMTVFAPVDAQETSKLITAVAKSPNPAYIRLVRPETPVVDFHHDFTIGQSALLRTGSDITVLGYGPVLTQVLEVTHPSLEIINCSSLKPLDEATILKSLKKTGHCLVVEDHQKIGGLGEAVAHLILDNNLKCKFVHLGVGNLFGQSSKDYQELYDYYGIGLASIKSALTKLTK